MVSFLECTLNVEYRERNRQQEIAELTSQGKLPHEVELEKHPEKSIAGFAWLMGKVAGAINVSLLDIR